MAHHEEDPNITSIIKDFGDKLSTTMHDAAKRTDLMLGQQLENFAKMQKLHEDRTDQLVGTISDNITAASGGPILSKRKDTDPPKLSEVDPVKWNSFRKCYETVATLNGWDDRYSVRRLSTCIRDQAARSIDHLDFESYANLAEAFAAIEKIYLNPAGIEFFKANFKLAQREGHETFLQWHTRCRELYVRAYPKTPRIEQQEDLKERFLLGLKDRNLAAQIKISDQYETWTYTDLLNRAQKIYGNTLVIHSAYSNKPLSSEGIASMDYNPTRFGTSPTGRPAGRSTGDPRTSSGQNVIRCHYCKKPGHVISQCFARQRNEQQTEEKNQTYRSPYNQARPGPNPRFSRETFNRSTPSRGSMRGRGRRRPGSGETKGRPRFPNTPGGPRVNEINGDNQESPDCFDHQGPDIHQELQDSVQEHSSEN